MDKSLQRQLTSPIKISQRTIENRLNLSPMARLGNIAFRELLEKFGGYGLLFSEMCAAKQLLTENRNTSNFFKWRDKEAPRVVWQIFGKDADIMADAAQRIQNEGFFGVDVNFGCCNANICKQGYGAALLRMPQKAFHIVNTIKKAVNIPVFVKFRVGWRDNPDGALYLARGFQNSGADALTFHPRIAPDRRGRPPKWSYIKKIKQQVDIPVFGNGNVFNRQDCQRMLNETSCDGIALGRIAIAKPWIFSAWTKNYNVTIKTIKETPFVFMELLEKHFDKETAFRRFRKYAIYYCSNFKFGKTLHTQIIRSRDFDEIRKELHAFFATNTEISCSPNLNFMH